MIQNLVAGPVESVLDWVHRSWAQAAAMAALAVIALFVLYGLAHAESMNEARAARHLRPLSIDGHLSALAREHALDLASQSIGRCSLRNLNHDGFFERRGPAGALAENVACGKFNATATIQQWMRSRGHLANIMLRSARSYGISSARSSTGVMYWVMDLGR